MRQFSTAALLMLQLPVLAHGLPYPVSQGDARDSSAPALTILDPQSTPGSNEVTPLQDVLTLVDHEPVADEGGQQTTLSRELADLSALQAQLASLSREISRRERWLAQATGTPPAPPDLTACDGLGCVFQAMLRKAKYTAAAVFDSSSSEDHLPAQQRNSSLTIPLPPWRRPHNNDTSGTTKPRVPDNNNNNNEDDGEEEAEVDLLPIDFLALNLPFAAFLLLLIFASLFHRFDGEYRDSAPVSLPLSTAEENNERRGTGGRRREERRRRWRGLWMRVLRVGGGRGEGSGNSGRWLWWRREGGIRLEDGPENRERGVVGDPYEHRDEKRGIWDEEERDWDEKDAVLLEDSCEEEARGGSEAESEAESESESESEIQGESGDQNQDRELLALGEELASFMAALDLVEGIVAAEEERVAGRQR
ncbi:hypothetical protein VTI74DRAFT_2449 [Chaetomium olivicolor]